MSIGIVIDSTLDVSDEIRDKVTVVPLTVRIGDKVFKDGELRLEELFSMIREAGSFPKTSQPSPGEFEGVYRKLLEDHDYVISIHISSKLSGTYSSAMLAAKQFEGRVFVFDTFAASIVGDFYVRKILEMQDKHPEEIMKELEKIRDKFKLFLTPGNLEFLKRSGRISKAKALLGAVLKLRPVLQVVDGELVA
ncbi:MAG: DegV family protein, partial [Thermotogaceae bacterium]|nr:DegV family protein [Thermotogaceae bacterium]